MTTIWTTLVLIAGIASTPLLAVSYVPQILQIAKTKNVEGINLNFWLILDASLLCFFIMAMEVFVTSGAWVLLFAQATNLVLALIVTFQVLNYRKK